MAENFPFWGETWISKIMKLMSHQKQNKAKQKNKTKQNKTKQKKNPINSNTSSARHRQMSKIKDKKRILKATIETKVFNL